MRRNGAIPSLTLVAVSVAGVALFAWPFLVRPSSPLSNQTATPVIFALLIPVLIAVVLVEMTRGRMDARAVAMLGVMSAMGAVMRPLSAGTAGVELVFFLMILGGRRFGPSFGFVLGSTTLFASALLTAGVGPWLPYQMLAASWLGMGAGLLPPAKGRSEIALLCAYGTAASVAYGLAMNLSFWPFTVGAETALSFVAGAPLSENVRRYLVFAGATSLGWDIGRAVTTAIGIAVLGRPILNVLRRASSRAEFAEPSFESATSDVVSEWPSGPGAGC